MPPHPSRFPWFLVPVALASVACSDNVTCVFSGSCEGGPGQISDNPAALPVDGDWIVDGPPRVDAAFPSGTLNPPTTPVVLVFSESIQVESLVSAIEIVPLIGGLVGNPIAGVVQELVSDGQVLILLPPVPLVIGDYFLRLADRAVVTDLTGQALNAVLGAQFGTFTVNDMPPGAPRLVTTFPANGARNQGETPQIVAVFDRPVLASSVDGASFDVRVGGSDPAFDPPPAALRVGTLGVEDTRAFLYRSLDASGLPVALGRDVDVELALSPAGDPILEQDGGLLAPQTITFRTLSVARVRAASLMSSPHDAIGLANLTPGDPEELTIQVDLDGLEPNDNIDLFMFGEGRRTTPDSPLIALQRTLRLTGTAPIMTATFLRSDVGLQFSEDPADVRFNDGPVSFAFRARRGSVLTPLRILDLDPDPELIQDPLLDTTRPSIQRLVGSTATSVFRSDLRGLSLAGAADEALLSADVTTPLGNNSARPQVVGSNDDGLFLASPVALDVVAGGTTTFELVGRDAARNASTLVAGTFSQLGVLGGSHLPGNPLDVEVFDSRTLLPLDGALVLVHSDLGDGLSFPFERSALTLADGRVQVATNGAPVVGSIVTVVAAGYDLFTLHDVPSARFSVPLLRSNQALARAAGQVVTSDPGAVAVLGGLDRRYDDSRRTVEQPRGFVDINCASMQGTFSCSYGPETIRDSRLGVRSMYAGLFLQKETSFQASQLLRAFALLVPLDAVAVGGLQQGVLEVVRLLDDPATLPADRAQDLKAFEFQVDPGSGVDLMDLADDPDTSGEPFVTVEVLVPGVAGAIAVSQGLAFGTGTPWTVRSVQPGTTTAGGTLGSAGVVDTDPFVRVEVVDQAGNAAGVRPRLSSIPAPAPDLPEFRALAAPVVIAPAAGSCTGGQAFSLLLTHAIADDRSEGGVYRVELRDEGGRGWTLWRFDPPGTAPVELRVVDVGDAGAVGLMDGTVVSLATAWAWNGLTPTGFLWTDVERRFELFSRAAALSFEKP